MAGFKDMSIYKKAFEMARMVFTLSKRFPSEEKFSLTDQVRRSSRSVTAQYAEGYRKKRYPAHFISKMTDADGENAETQVWLDHAVACGYVTENDIAPILKVSEEVGRMLGDMIENPEKYVGKRP
ncbi:MAG: four helix bundle protein [Flavobacteriales bacterium]|nr:four helix bundle protein [Flavobacteriales bacterium]MBK9286692.1 four helix bundle protein [Flavobacteriales bacterium]MBL0035182.1 four helix bundle protein [Flavobacteriales bacterium]